MRDTLVGAINTQLMQAGDEVVSVYHRRIEHGYPTPSLGRDEVLDKALPWLQQHNIWSRGRFGSYKVSGGVHTPVVVSGRMCVRAAPAAMMHVLPNPRPNPGHLVLRLRSLQYEVANQDHSLMLGVECVDNILYGTKELTLAFPDIVNAKKNGELLYKKK